jgi:hypothetical protein
VLLLSVEVLLFLDVAVESSALSAEKEDFQKNAVVWKQHVPSIGQISVSLLMTLRDTE